MTLHVLCQASSYVMYRRCRQSRACVRQATIKAVQQHAVERGDAGECKDKKRNITSQHVSHQHIPNISKSKNPTWPPVYQAVPYAADWLHSETAKGADVLTAVLEAAYVRQAIIERVRQQTSADRRRHSSSSSSSSNSSKPKRRDSSRGSTSDRHKPHGSGESNNGSSCQQQQHDFEVQQAHAHAEAVAQLRHGFPFNEKELHALVVDAHRKAAHNAKRFVQEVLAAGWKVSDKG